MWRSQEENHNKTIHSNMNGQINNQRKKETVNRIRKTKFGQRMGKTNLGKIKRGK